MLDMADVGLHGGHRVAAQLVFEMGQGIAITRGQYQHGAAPGAHARRDQPMPLVAPVITMTCCANG
jgi:hypothetical protein